MKWMIRILSWMIPHDERGDWVREWKAEWAFVQVRGSRGLVRGPRDFGKVLAGAAEDASVRMFGSWGQGSLLRDGRFALRSLRRNPGFTAVAVITLGLGLGANTAIYSVVNATIVRDLPVQDPDRLLVATAGRAGRSGAFSAPDYLDLKNQSTSFSSLSAVQRWSATLTGRGLPQRVTRSLVSHDLFTTVGVDAVIGRTFLPGEDELGAASVVVIDNALWMSAFGGDSRALGTSVEVDGVPHEVIGVLPVGFRLPPFNSQIWVPLQFQPDALEARGRHNLFLVGRLTDGLSKTAAQDEVTAIGRRLAQAHPRSNEGKEFYLRALHSAALGDSGRTLTVLLGAVGILLLIACVNVTNLTLARGIAREQELAVRVSLGAGRGRLISQILGETVLISLMGGLLGAGLAVLLIDPITAILPAELAAISDIRVDGQVLGFSFLLAFVTGLLAGLSPALRLSRNATQAGVGGVLRTRSRRRGVGNGLVAGQFALATTLLVGAGLLLRSLMALYAVDLGMEIRGLTSLSVTLPVADYPTGPLTINGVQSILRELSAQPGVNGVTAVSQLPLSGAGLTTSVALEGADGQDINSPSASVHVASLGYFETLQIPVLRGRTFDSNDALGSELVGMINQAAAERWWPGENPLGKTLNFAQDSDGNPLIRRIVGVVADVRSGGPDSQPNADFYQPAAQTTEVWRWFGRQLFFVVRAQDATITAQQIRTAVNKVDPNLAVSRIRTMEEAMDGTVVTSRVLGTLVGAFAAVALLLASIGIYGVMAFSVRQRKQEIAVRMALGAEQSTVLAGTVKAGIRVAFLGTVIGVAASFILGRWLDSFLFGVNAADMGTYAAVAGILTLVTLAACLIPASRAASTNPAQALRGE